MLHADDGQRRRRYQIRGKRVVLIVCLLLLLYLSILDFRLGDILHATYYVYIVDCSEYTTISKETFFK